MKVGKKLYMMRERVKARRCLWMTFNYQVCRPFSIWRLSTRDASSRGVEIAGVFCRRVDETPRGEVGFHRSKSLHTTLYVKDVLLPHFALLSRGGVRQHHRRKGWSLHRPTDGDVEFLGHSKGHGRDRNVCQRKVQQHALVHYWEWVCATYRSDRQFAEWHGEIQYHESYLTVSSEVIRKDAEVRGYFIWSLLETSNGSTDIWYDLGCIMWTSEHCRVRTNGQRRGTRSSSLKTTKFERFQKYPPTKCSIRYLQNNQIMFVIVRILCAILF